MIKNNRVQAFIILIIFFTSFQTVDAQFTRCRLEVYSDLERCVSKIEVVYSENFDGRTNWSLFDREKQNARLYNGRYVLDNYKKKGKLTVEKELDFDHNKDHEIEFNIGMSPDSKKKSYPIVQFWASKDQSYALFLDFPKKSIEVYYYASYSKKEKIRFKLDGDKHSKKVESLKQGHHSLITVRKISDEIYLFINKKFIAKLPFYSLVGNKLKFNVYEDSLIEIDDITVKALTPLRKIGDY